MNQACDRCGGRQQAGNPIKAGHATEETTMRPEVLRYLVRTRGRRSVPPGPAVMRGSPPAPAATPANSDLPWRAC